MVATLYDLGIMLGSLNILLEYEYVVLMPEDESSGNSYILT
jgi:hypothetical protein